jgi:hypothetical protein
MLKGSPVEIAMADDDPVATGTVYVCDDKPTLSPITGTVADLKAAIGCVLVAPADMAARFGRFGDAPDDDTLEAIYG